MLQRTGRTRIIANLSVEADRLLRVSRHDAKARSRGACDFSVWLFIVRDDLSLQQPLLGATHVLECRSRTNNANLGT